MQKRRAARERLLQALYGLKLSGSISDLDGLRAHFPIGDDPHPDEDLRYCLRIVDTLSGRLAQVDALIQGSSRNWRLERMDAVDLSLLRLATAELLSHAAPDRVIVNEAVELAKRYGSEGSATFVNGVLDGVLRGLRAREAGSEPS